MKISFTLIKQFLFRNSLKRNGSKAKKNQVNLEYFNAEVNLGDALSPIVFQWMLNQKNININKAVKGTKHLMMIGSILGGSGFFDATVWGSGIKSFDQISTLGKRRFIQKMDIRSVRGPLTKAALIGCGYNCPEVYGDPAVLMPLIYKPNIEKTNDVGVILHFHQNMEIPSNLKNINIKTKDYQSFVDELCSCKKIISSSLHGIILAEAYGIPAVFLSKDRDIEMLKYFDWYFSTGRRNMIITQSFDEALSVEPMELPDLSKMQKDIINVFPYDLWNE